MLTTGQIMEALNSLAPWNLAEEWDRVGLEVGRLDQLAGRILVALDMNERVLEEGLNRQVDGFIIHHPFLFKPITRVDTSSVPGRILARLLKKDLFLIAAHTNMDKAAEGLNQYLADLFGLLQVRPLEPVPTHFVKIVVFVPEADASRIRKVMSEAGAGQIGDYTECAFQTSGVGGYIPGPTTHPLIGQLGKLTEVRETRLEMQAPKRDVYRILRIIRQNHPYEEPAIDVYPLDNAVFRQGVPGLGRVGQLPESVTLGCFCQTVKDILKLNSIRVSGQLDQKVARIAICSGSGGDLLHQAMTEKADLYLTGELHYHDYLTAAGDGMAVIEAGHWGTEHIFVPLVNQFLKFQFAETALEVINSRSVAAEPFIVI